MAESPSFRTGYDYDEQKQKVAGLVWDVATLSWVKATQAGASGGIGIPSFDYAALSPGATSDVWTFRTGGSGGVLVATVTIAYTDASKATISTVTKT